MDQYDVGLKFDEDCEPLYYYETVGGIFNPKPKKGGLRWAYDKTESYDWKDNLGVANAEKRLAKKGEVVVLFAGDDSIILALLEDAEQPKQVKRKRK